MAGTAYVEKSPEAQMLYLATVRAGHIFIPLNSAYRENELRHLLGDAQPSFSFATARACSPPPESPAKPMPGRCTRWSPMGWAR
jgi:acyl-coenzyme A synthetase/AMP-(fatty) acid ligase